MERMMFVAPSSRGSNLETVQSFYVALLHELEHGGYTDAERALLADERLYYGRYLNPRLRSYFEQTVIPQVAHGVSFLMTDTRTPRILDPAAEARTAVPACIPGCRSVRRHVRR